jgi:RNA polymerase sigma-70 factor (sigma-E family)
VDQDAEFREFVRARGASLSRAAYLLTGDHHAAEELLQEALTRTLGRWRGAIAEGNPEAYVRRVMVNQVRKAWRRRWSSPTPDVPEKLDDRDATLTVLDRMAMAASLRLLAPGQRAVLFLRYYEDLSEVETAQRLGCTVGTVKRQTHDALTRLRRVLPATTTNRGEHNGQ